MLPRLYIKGPNVLFFIYCSFSFWLEENENNAVKILKLSLVLKVMVIDGIINNHDQNDDDDGVYLENKADLHLECWVWWGMNSFGCLQLCFPV